MKKATLYSAVLLAGLISLFISQTTWAHVTEGDGSIGAVLHIDPADDPIAGEPSRMLFEFQDKNNQFSVSNCACRLVVEQAGKIIYDQLFDLETGATFTFPERDIYTIKAIGSPKNGASYSSFELDYPVRVERGTIGDGTNVDNRFEQNLPFVIAGTIGLVFIFFVIRYRIVNNVNQSSS